MARNYGKAILELLRSEGNTSFLTQNKLLTFSTLLRLGSGLIILAVGVLFFFYNLLQLIHDVIFISASPINSHADWHLHVLKYIDKFLIFLTTMYVGEKIIHGASLDYEEAKKYKLRNEVLPTLNVMDFDHNLAAMVVITISITFLGIVLQEKLKDISQQILLIGAGMGLVILSIGLWSFFSKKRDN